MTTLPVKGDLDGSTPSHNQGIFKVAIGNLRDFVADLFGTDSAVIRTVHDTFKANGLHVLHNLTLTPSVGSNALTMAIKTAAGADPSAASPVLVGQRHATVGTGSNALKAITAATSTVISSGSTAGHVSTVPGWIYWYLIDHTNVELAWSSTYFGPHGIVSTTAEGGAGAADSANIMYSTTARATVPFRCVGRTLDTQTVAGTWTALPTRIELWPFDDSQRTTETRTSNIILDAHDHGKTINVTTGFTQTFQAVTTLKPGWRVNYRIAAGQTVTFDPNSSETIDGVTTKAIVGPASGQIFSDGTALFTQGFVHGNLADLTTEDQVFSGGMRVTSKSLTPGTITVDCGDRPLQYIANDGAFTINAPANDGSILLLITNGASAGAITWSGFQVGSNVGDAFTITNGHDFLVSIARINGISTYHVKALQ